MFTVIEVEYKISKVTGGSYFTVKDTGRGIVSRQPFDYGAKSAFMNAAVKHLEKIGVTEFKKIENAGRIGNIGKTKTYFVIEH